MTKKQKIAAGVGVVAFGYLYYRIRQLGALTIQTAEVTTAMADVMEAQYVVEVEERFADIVEHYDD